MYVRTDGRTFETCSIRSTLSKSRPNKAPSTPATMLKQHCRMLVRSKMFYITMIGSDSVLAAIGLMPIVPKFAYQMSHIMAQNVPTSSLLRNLHGLTENPAQYCTAGDCEKSCYRKPDKNSIPPLSVYLPYANWQWFAKPLRL